MDAASTAETASAATSPALCCCTGVAALIVAGHSSSPRAAIAGARTPATAGAIQATMVSALPAAANAALSDNVLLTSERPARPASSKGEHRSRRQGRRSSHPGEEDQAKVAEKPTPSRQTSASPYPGTAHQGRHRRDRRHPHRRGHHRQGQKRHGQRQSYRTAPSAAATPTTSQIINSTVAQDWYTAEADPRTSRASASTILFDINRDGAPSTSGSKPAADRPPSTARRCTRYSASTASVRCQLEITSPWSTTFDYRQP